MDDDDESRDKGRKTNADRDFKPRHGKRQDHAPRGVMGRAPAGPGGQQVRMSQSESQGSQKTDNPIEKDIHPKTRTSIAVIPFASLLADPPRKSCMDIIPSHCAAGPRMNAATQMKMRVAVRGMVISLAGVEG